MGTKADCNERSCQGPHLLEINKIMGYYKDMDRNVGQQEEFQPTTQGTSQEKLKEVILIAPKHATVSATIFLLFQKEGRSVHDGDLKIDPGNYEGPNSGWIQRYAWGFSQESSNELLDHGVLDMKFEFKDRQEPRNTSLWPMSPVELEEIQRYSEENLGKWWIKRSKSPLSAPIVFAEKKDGSI